MNQKRIRGPLFHKEYEYSSDIKDQIEDLLTRYTNIDEVISRAIEALHETHFGSSKTKTLPPTYSQTFTGKDDTAVEKVNELWEYFQDLKDQLTQQNIAATNNKSQQVVFSEEANERIMGKIDELGMKFSKIVSEKDKKSGQEQITAEMSNEEVVQLLKRIDKLESKLTKAISQSRAAMPTGGSSRRPMRDMGEPPKIGQVKAIDGRPPELEDRPLLEDVLDTVIVSIEDE